MLCSFGRILVVAPHTDDAELGMGGTIHRITRMEKAEIQILTLSDCDDSLPPGLGKGALAKESLLAAQDLGINREKVTIRKLPVRRFSENRQEILDILIDVRNSYSPDVVFAPSRVDIHQDHKVVRDEVERAFKYESIFGYELAWNCKNMDATLFVPLEEVDLQAKINALKQYQSQSRRPYMNESFIRSLATMRGLQANSIYSEAFDIFTVKWRI